MFKIIALLTICATAATSNAINSASIELSPTSSILGVVDPLRRCGGVGTPLQLRMKDCDGRCALMPGYVYNIEKDFLPSMATPSLTLKIELCFDSGFCMQIIFTELPNSSVQPGFIYTAKYSIVPNDILSGQTVEFRGYLIHTNTGITDICVAADIDIL